MSRTARRPACPGRFYPRSATELDRKVDEFLTSAEEPADALPRAVIAPHAGYPFSGAVAGQAFRRLAPFADAVDRVVVIGPSHFVPVDGIAASHHDSFETPLGGVAVDRESIGALVEAGLVELDDEPHRREHSLETHLPFLQKTLGEFELVPLVTGQDVDDLVARILVETWHDESTLVSVSSDLSHFLDYETARQVDDRTRRAIEALDPDEIDDEQACGNTSIRGLLQVAAERDLSPRTLAMCNSGDRGADRDRVVGYGAWAFYD